MTAEIIDNRYPVKGMCVWFPFGFAIKKNVYGIIRELLDPDHQETQFPLMIPENEFMKEAQHIKGFEEEVYWVTHGGTFASGCQAGAPAYQRDCYLSHVQALDKVACRSASDESTRSSTPSATRPSILARSYACGR